MGELGLYLTAAFAGGWLLRGVLCSRRIRYIQASWQDRVDRLRREREGRATLHPIAAPPRRDPLHGAVPPARRPRRRVPPPTSIPSWRLPTEHERREPRDPEDRYDRNRKETA